MHKLVISNGLGTSGALLVASVWEELEVEFITEVIGEKMVVII